MIGRLLLIVLLINYVSVRAQVAPLVIGESGSLYSAELKEARTINVYLPQGYNPADTTRYPIIYLLDGGLDEDFLHVAGLVQFNSFDWIKRVPKSIVVGIVNVDRQRDFTYPTTSPESQKIIPKGGHSAKFIAFLKNELQPFVEKNYRAGPMKTLIGESLGGLLAAEVLLKQPRLFTHYIIISPSIWWDNGSLLNQKVAKSSAKVYVGVGKEGQTPGKPRRTMETDARSLATKLKTVGIQVYFDYLPAETHATIGHPALFNAFKWIYRPGK